MKRRANPSHCAGVAALFLLAVGVAFGGEDAGAVVREICRRVYVEGRSEADLQRESSQIAALGEPGRKALIGLARAKGQEGDTAMSFLLFMSDARASEIARELLSRRKAAPELKERALRVVAHLRDSASATRVVELFRSDQDQDVVWEAMRALSAFGDEASLRALREALLDPRYRHMRGDLVKAVGVLGYEEAVDVLVKLLDDPVYRTHESARGNIMASLARIGTPRSLAQAVSVARTLDPTNLASEMRLRDLVDIFRRKRLVSKDPDEIARLDALIRELDPSVRKRN